LEVEKLNAVPGDQFTFDKVLLLNEDGVSTVGQPLLTNISVVATVLEHTKGDKIRVAKFKAKARHRRVQGHRQSLTKVQVQTIAGIKEKKAEKPIIKDQKVKSKITSKE